VQIRRHANVVGTVDVLYIVGIHGDIDGATGRLDGRVLLQLGHRLRRGHWTQMAGQRQVPIALGGRAQGAGTGRIAADAALVHG